MHLTALFFFKHFFLGKSCWINPPLEQNQEVEISTAELMEHHSRYHQQLLEAAVCKDLVEDNTTYLNRVEMCLEFHEKS